MTNLFQRLAVAGIVGTGLTIGGIAIAQAQTAAPAAGGAAQAEKPAQPDPVVARVNGKEIRFMEVMQRMSDLPPQFRNQPISVLFPTLVTRVVDEVLLSEAAEAKKVAESEEYKAQLELYKVQLAREFYLRGEIEAKVNDETLRREYDRRMAATPPAREVHARHILLEKEEDAKAVIAELDKGADFAELARTKSTGPSGSSGGDLGFFRKERMVPEFSEAAFSMAVGSHSKTPVKTQFGWHVIKVEAERQGEAPKFDQLKPELTQEMQRKAFDETLTALRDAATIEKFNIDGTQKSSQTPGKAAPKQ